MKFNKTFLIIFCLIYLTLPSLAQTNYDKGYKEGFAKAYCYNQAVGCIPKAPTLAPLPRINENSNSYQNGYDRGYAEGLDYRREENSKSNTNSQHEAVKFNPYISQIPTSEFGKKSYKQKLYEERFTWVNTTVNNINEFLGNQFDELDHEARLKLTQSHNEWKIRNLVQGNPDLTNDRVFNQIKNYFSSFTSSMLSEYSRIKQSKLNASIPNSNSSLKNNKTDIEIAQSLFDDAKNEFKKDNIETALKLINESIKLDPNYANSYAVRGYIFLLGIKNYQSALIDFNKCIQMEPSNSNSYYYRAICYENLGNIPEAIKDYTQTIQLDKEYIDAYFRRALNKSKLGDYRGAINDYDYLITHTDTKKISDFSTIFNNKAYSLVKLKDYKTALIWVNKSLDINKTKSYIWDTRGEIYYELGEYNKCIEDMTTALNLSKNKSDNSFYYRGLAKIKLNNHTEGCLDLSKAGELGKNEAYDAITKMCK